MLPTLSFPCTNTYIPVHKNRNTKIPNKAQIRCYSLAKMNHTRGLQYIKQGRQLCDPESSNKHCLQICTVAISGTLDSPHHQLGLTSAQLEIHSLCGSLEHKKMLCRRRTVPHTSRNSQYSNYTIRRDSARIVIFKSPCDCLSGSSSSSTPWNCTAPLSSGLEYQGNALRCNM